MGSNRKNYLEYSGITHDDWKFLSSSLGISPSPLIAV